MHPYLDRWSERKDGGKRIPAVFDRFGRANAQYYHSFVFGASGCSTYFFIGTVLSRPRYMV